MSVEPGAGSRQSVREAFVAALDLPPDTQVETLEIGATTHWDSVGHMALVAELEDRYYATLAPYTAIITHAASLAKYTGQTRLGRVIVEKRAYAELTVCVPRSAD